MILGLTGVSEENRRGRCGRRQRITESQHGRGWKGPLWVTQPNPLPQQGHPEQAAQDLVQVGLEYLQRRRLHSLPGQPGLRHPEREEVLPPVILDYLPPEVAVKDGSCSQVWKNLLIHLQSSLDS